MWGGRRRGEVAEEGGSGSWEGRRAPGEGVEDGELLAAFSWKEASAGWGDQGRATRWREVRRWGVQNALTMGQLLAEEEYQVVCFDLEFTSSRVGQDSKVDLASAIIDPYNMEMKDESKKDKNTWHNAWCQRLDEEHFKYVTKDAYTSYEMYKLIVDMRKCLRLSTDGDRATEEKWGRHKK
ncbi:putative ubiquitin-conjugating enzyme E2 26 [Hordeum vulgare]|nr:putative ubiquitin-conjugating enzyme E2 26 [Hordeum vulgare]